MAASRVLKNAFSYLAAVATIAFIFGGLFTARCILSWLFSIPSMNWLITYCSCSCVVIRGNALRTNTSKSALYIRTFSSFFCFRLVNSLILSIDDLSCDPYISIKRSLICSMALSSLSSSESSFIIARVVVSMNIQ